MSIAGAGSVKARRRKSASDRSFFARLLMCDGFPQAWARATEGFDLISVVLIYEWTNASGVG